jgi:UDP-N-acetylmuramate--alanine ligase
MRPKSEMQLHFVGIGGIGMSGIAEVFLTQGYRISGSDQAEGEATRRLAKLGAQIFLGHRPENIRGAQVVVISSAVKPTNPEVLEAKRLRIPVIPRAEMLGELMRGKTGIAVAGTHGKTTTTSMLSTIFTNAEKDPTCVIGGRVDLLGGNAKVGLGEWVIAEADESDGSFLHLPATYGVITNIDNDHLDHYQALGAIEDAFVDFVANVPFYGAVAVCQEDSGVKRTLNRLTKPLVTYGWTPDSDYWATEVESTGFGSKFFVSNRSDGRLGQVEIHVPGKHNILNALGSLAISMTVGLSFEEIRQGLDAYRGVRRRFEVKWKSTNGRKVLVDDYGHHPTEIAATLQAARQFWPGRIITVFQPHRYSRTLHCHDGFLSAFHQSNLVYLTDIYSAGEEPIEGVSAQALTDSIREVSPPGQQVQWVGNLETALAQIQREWTDGDLLICMGAGTITKLPEQILAGMK